ncbi:MAG: site-2 protease family protein [Pirellulales bacterium]
MEYASQPHDPRSETAADGAPPYMKPPLVDVSAGDNAASNELLSYDARQWHPPVPVITRRRRRVVPAVLFLATCLSTFWVGVTSWMPLTYMGSIQTAQQIVLANWQQGLVYMGAVLAILLTHEMGHFVFTLRYHIPASYPLFIPLPINAFGTMGAVIGMDGLRANRRQMFDMGLAGPLAGLIVAIPIMWLGIERLDVSSGPAMRPAFYNPLLVQIMLHYLRPDVPADTLVSIFQMNPYFMAGWVGLLITGLNMLPISQLDGGHVIYALFGRRAHRIARVFLLAAMAYVIIYEVYVWTVMLVLITLLGTDHPPTSDDTVPLGPWRWAIGLASLAIPILCFPPQGLAL